MNHYQKIKSDSEFLENRRKGVGSSDLPILAGLTKRWGQTPLTLFREKKGLSPSFEGNERTYWGHELEVSVLKKFISGRYGDDAAFDFQAAAIRGRSSGPFKVKTECFHPVRKYCLAHADLVVIQDGAVTNTPNCLAGKCAYPEMLQCTGCEFNRTQDYLVEAKTSGLYSAKRREGQIFEGYDPDDRSQFGIPDKVFMQVQWQMYVYGVTEAWVVVLIDTADYREYGPIIYDPRHVEQSLALAEKFWALVEAGQEPSPITWGDVISVFSKLEDKTRMVSGEEESQARQIIARGKDLKERAKIIKEEIEDINMALGILAGDTRSENGEIIRTMNRVLNDSSGNKLATFRDQTKDSLSLSEWLNSAEKKKKACDAAQKKFDAGKITAEECEKIQESNEWTDQEIMAMEVEPKLRKLGAYKTSEVFRVVSY